MIRLENVRKEYDDLVAVNDLNVVIPEGQVYGLIGPNGAGKTTTIRMACGLLEPTAGSVHVSGVDVHQEPERAQQFIGYLSDFFSLYEDLKVWEYLDYFAHAYKMPEAGIRARVDEVIQEVGLEVKTDAMIKGLSRGMKQRLGIARAVIHKPKVLLLDEPASGLDPKARLDLRNLLRSMSQEGTTVLISSHILTELEGFCTSIGLMEKGRMVRSGTIQEITATESEYRVVRVSWVGDSAAMIKARLEANPKVSGISLNNLEGVCKFAGPEEELADVLRDLVSAGVRVVSFGEVKQTVEDLYMKISRNEVM
ncbi:MAG TPA: ABC transporter ATP-binding protein [Terriglobia bacterium]|nr:ABC transporter ATP-binding protein [Terriglobia bacterium]